jgi:hypothetical protein
MKILGLLFIVFGVDLFNQISFAELSDFEKDLMVYQTKQTKESIVEMNGHMYRKVEYSGKFYYLQLSQPTDPVKEHTVNCSDRELIDKEQPSRIYTETKLTQRSSLFVEALQVSCSGKVLPALKVGFTLPDSPHDIFKNKRIFLFPQPGFYGEF